MFIAIVIPVARGDRRVALCALVAVIFSCILYYVPVLNEIPSGFTIIISAVLASLIFAIFSPIPDEDESESDMKDVGKEEENA